MAQTTAGMSFVDCAVQVSNNASSWTDISGSSGVLTVSGFNRQSGEAYTFDGDHPVVTAGKREPIEITYSCIYTETTDEGFEIAWEEFDADDGDAFWIRWVPQTGGWTWTSTTGEIITCLPPGGEAAPGEPIMCSVTIKAASVDKA